MIVSRSIGHELWTDLSSPTKEELDSIVLSQKIDPLVVKDLLSPTPKQFAKEFSDGVYAVIHIPSFRHSHSLSFEQEIDFIVTKNGVITSRYDSIDALHYFSKQVEVGEILFKENGNHNHLFIGLMKEIYKFLSDEADYMRDWTKEIEKNIFEGKEKDMVFGISAASRNLLNFRRIIGPHETILNTFVNVSRVHFGEKFEKEAKMLLEEWTRLQSLLHNISEMLNELRETNNSILSTKQNEIMKILTVMAFIILPLSLITSIFGMNTKSIPIVGAPHDFWVVIGIMAAATIAMFAFFRYKKWL